MTDVSIAEMIVPHLYPGTRDSGTDRDRVTGSAGHGWTATWSTWGTTGFVTVTDPALLPAARRLVQREFAAAEKAAARFRQDAEVHRLYRAGGRPITVGARPGPQVAAALQSAERTDGDLDPTVAAAVTAGSQASKSADHSAIPACGRNSGARPAAGWQRVQLRGRQLSVPAGVTLDLSATATAFSCDRAAARVWVTLGTGALVGIGGDVASAGPAPDGGWRVSVDGRGAGRSEEILLPAGAALATSHFTARDGAPDLTGQGGRGQLIDPRTGRPAPAVWQTASVIGFSCLEAATCSAAALVRGLPARAWLNQLWVPARLVTIDADVIDVGTWAAHRSTSFSPATDFIAGTAAGSDPVRVPRPAETRRTF